MKLNWGLILATALEIAIFANLVIIDLALFSPQKPHTALSVPIKVDCGDNCKSQIQDSVQAALNALPAPTPITNTVVRTTVSKTATGIKEFFVPLGSGSTQTDQWEDISGVEAYIDTNGYTNIQTVYFEVSMHIPTKNGVVYARLYNVTDKHPVWFSDVSTDSDVSKQVSAQIKLDPGNKQYRVQMKTTLSYPSLLDFARVKIITK